ncbi:MAG TPA: hypothetical protein VGJ57_07640 [Nitrospirales bacterium]|jgi:hypothetical protein
MKPTLILTLACAATLGLSTAGIAEDPVGRADTNIISQGEIKGEVLKVEGDNFVVKDERSKKEVRFTIEKDVKASLDRPLKQGDRIEAFLTPEGYAKSVRFEATKGSDTDRAGKDLGEIQAPGGLSKDSSGKSRQKKGGMSSPEGSNPTLSPDGKGSASGG